MKRDRKEFVQEKIYKNGTLCVMENTCSNEACGKGIIRILVRSSYSYFEVL